MDSISYVYKDYGIGYFADYSIEFEAEISASDTGAEIDGICISNTIGTRADTITANDGQTVVFWNDSGNVTIRIKDENTDNVDFYTGSGSTIPHYYFRFARSGTTLTLQIYSDSNRSVEVDTLSVVCETGTKRYLYAIMSREDSSGGGAQVATGYIQNLEIITADQSPSESPSDSPSESASESPSESP